MTHFSHYLKKMHAGLAFAFLCAIAFNASGQKTKVFTAAPQEVKGFSGIIMTKNKKVVACSQPKNALEFNTKTKKWKAFIEFPYFSFTDDVAKGFTGNPAKETLSFSSFLDGRLITRFPNGDLINSNLGPFPVSPVTGVFEVGEDLGTQGINPVAFRPSNGRIYFQAFDPSVILSVDLLGSFTSAVTLSIPTGLNGFSFGPDDKLYGPDVAGNQIVKIDVDSGLVTTVVPNIIYPIALKVSSQGILYFISRGTGEVYEYNQTTATLTLLATLPPALDNLCLNLSEKKLFVSNDQNTLFKINIAKKKVKIEYTSPITQPWDLAFDPETNTLWVADGGSIKEFNSENGQFIRKLVLDSITSGFLGFGLACNIDIEPGIDGKIVFSDVTIGNIGAVNKDFTPHEYISGFENGLFTRQNFATLRVETSDPAFPNGEFYLALDAVGGTIVQVYRDQNGVVQSVPYFSGLTAPIKLKRKDGYLYIVEAGELLQGNPDTGRVSRVPLTNTPPAPQTQEILLDGLNNPQGLDLYGDKLVVVEVDNSQILQASAVAPSTPVVILDDLDENLATTLSSLNPIPATPKVGIATDSIGKRIWVVQIEPNNILKLKRKNY